MGEFEGFMVRFLLRNGSLNRIQRHLQTIKLRLRHKPAKNARIITNWIYSHQFRFNENSARTHYGIMDRVTRFYSYHVYEGLYHLQVELAANGKQAMRSRNRS